MAASPATKKLKLPVQQLVILSICRFAEPVALTSVFPYLPNMIESFNVPQNDVGQWAGITSAVFSFSQCLTGLAWGRASDYFGRKKTILSGLTCTMIASLLFGFSRTLWWAILARSLAGISSGTVGIIRTTVAEMVPERELQPRAFSIMPLIWTIGSIVGPILGGSLADPVNRYSDIFGESKFFKKFPFSLPNIVGSVLFIIGILSGILFLKETLETRKDDRDYGRILGQALIRGCSIRRKRSSSMRRDSYKQAELDSEMRFRGPPPTPPSYREVFSYQSSLNLFAYTLLALHSVAYDQLIAVFLHTRLNEDQVSHGGFAWKFAGGFGLSEGRIGLLLTGYGIVGMFLQFLVFPVIARKIGILNCLRAISALYPFIYFTTPFAVLLPTETSRQIGIFIIMLFKCLAGVFSFPCTTILLTNSAGSLRLLGTLNGVATSISAAGRGIGPFAVGTLFTWGMKIGWIIIPWWALAVFAALGHIPTWWLVEMEGFGAKDDDEESIASDAEADMPLLATGSDSTGQPSTMHRTSTFESIVEEPEDESTGAEDQPLIAKSKSPTPAAPLNKTTTRSSNPILDDSEDEDTAAPLLMPQIVRSGRRLSSNLGLSIGLGRTDAGSGFGTRGPELGMGPDRSRSRSQRRSLSSRRQGSASRTRNGV